MLGCLRCQPRPTLMPLVSARMGVGGTDTIDTIDTSDTFYGIDDSCTTNTAPEFLAH